MTDREVIVELTTRMGLLADERRWGELEGLFTNPVHVDYTTLNGGEPATLAPADLVAGWRAGLGGLEATQHIVASHVIELDGDAATCVANFQATHRLTNASGGALWTLGGRYDWRLRLTEDGWRISGLILTVLWGDGNQRVMDLSANRGAAMDVVERFFAALEAMDVEAFLDVWAEDGVQEMPFAPEGFPRRLDGKEDLRRQYGGLPEAYSAMRFPRRPRPAAEPGVAFAEYRGDISLRAGGRYDNRYIGVFEVRDGRLQRFTEYFNPDVLAAAFGDKLRDTFSLPEDS